jgi:hypothetical protein
VTSEFTAAHRRPSIRDRRGPNKAGRWPGTSASSTPPSASRLAAEEEARAPFRSGRDFPQPPGRSPPALKGASRNVAKRS